MTEEEIKYWALRMQKAAIGDRNANHQIRVMEKHKPTIFKECD